MTALLEVQGLEAYYGRTKALHGVSFSMAAGGITTILGANGAGKTTTLRAISRMVRTSGSVRFDGQPLDHRSTEDVVQLGIAHAPEGRGTFTQLSVEENMRLGAWCRREKGGLQAHLERIFGYFPVLRERRTQMAGTLSGGEQQMLAVARALMLRPRLLLMDEPSLGLAPLIVREIFRILRAVNQESGVSILLVEQNAALALDLADHVFLLETGRVVLDGPSEVLRTDDAIRRSYLGY
ncbi:MAG: ABC transporter ATP-binding protein [Candidatus Rokubacteria bacterium]|nr:ABC transporter ATP-binding protein [Candidatus Rokubacteria bacterium]